MKALVYAEPGTFSTKEVPKPEVTPNQVLVQVKSCGVCKTDIHIHNGAFISKFPLIPGHEFAGVIVDKGSEVQKLHVGQRVVCDNTVLCGHCYYCKRNEPLYCENFYSLGVNGPGGFSEYVAVNHDKVFVLPDAMSFDEAAFTEPTACAVHGLDRIQLKTGDDVLMFGAGPTGIILAQLLAQNGASNLVVAAPTKFKLDILNELGITNTVLVDRNDYSKHQKKIQAQFPKGFDVVIDATGHMPMLEHCFQYTKKGTKVVCYGVYDESKQLEVNPYRIFEDELQIIGSFAQTHCFDRALTYLDLKIVQVDKLITHTFNLDDYDQALDTVLNDKTHLKVMIHPGE